MRWFKFRSKTYQGDWEPIDREIISDLRREELIAFAPKARVAQEDTPVPPTPQGPPLASFPFMRLPLELRTIIYKMHFAQAAKITSLPSPRSCLVSVEEPAFQSRGVWTSNEGVPVRLLWTLSKDLYHEAMPLYFQTTEFTFNSLESLAHFLNVIGPYHRQHVTCVNLNSSRFDSSMDRGHVSDSETYAGLQALKLLRTCPALQHMQFNLPIVPYHLADTSEWFRAILKIRDLKSVDIKPVNDKTYWPRDDHMRIRGHNRQVHIRPVNLHDYHWRDDHMKIREHNKQVLQVLKQPHRPAAIKKREDKGISRVVVPRTFFGSVTRSEVRAWFDARESTAITESSKDGGDGVLGNTELEHLKRERKLVEASFDHSEDDQYQVLNPL